MEGKDDTDDEDTEVDVHKEEGTTPKHEQTEEALKLLEDRAKTKLEGCKKLRKLISKLSENKLEQLGQKIPVEITGKFSEPVMTFLQENEDELVWCLLAIGLYYLEQHHQHKDPSYKVKKKKHMAKQFEISECNFTKNL